MTFDQYINHNDIETRASKILDEYGIDKPVVDVIRIASGLGVEVKEIEMPKGYEDVAGFYDKNKKIIYVADSDTPQRKLFSIAHELGHIFLDHKNATVLFRIPRQESKYPKGESEANSFAAHLLIPSYMVYDYMERYGLTKSDYRELSKLFGVPNSTMKNALENLK